MEKQMSSFSEFWRNFVSPTGKLEVEAFEAKARLANGETIVMTGTFIFEVLKAIAQEKDVKFTLEEGQSVSFNVYNLNSHIQDKVLDFFKALPEDGTQGTLDINEESGEAVYTSPSSISEPTKQFRAEYKLKRKGLPKVEIL